VTAPVTEGTTTVPAADDWEKKTALPAISDLGEGKPGRISGGRVNIRARMGVDASNEIIVTANENTPVLVLGRHENWLKIAYPADQFCFVHQRYLEGSIPTDIPESGFRAVINADNVDICVRPWSKSTVVGTLGKGDPVNVVGIRGGNWLKITPPKTAVAWVAASYVKVDGEVQAVAGAEVAAAKQTDPLAQLSKTGQEAEKKKQERLAKINEEIDQRQAEQKRKVDNIINGIENRLAEIDQDIEAQKAAINTAPIKAQVEEEYSTGETKAGGFTGWVEYIGRVGKRPAAFRLVKGGEFLFYLRSSTFDLREFVSRRVVCDGTVELAPGFEANVLVVNKIEILGLPPENLRDQTLNNSYPIDRPAAPTEKKEEQPVATDDDNNVTGETPVTEEKPAAAIVEEDDGAVTVEE
jgi:hypothetical protein